MEDLTIKVVVNEGDAEQVLYFEDDVVSIGRSSRNLIRLADKTCSRYHCVLELKDRQCRLRDLGSANNTLINGNKVSDHILQDGDQIQIGSARLSVTFLTAIDADDTPAAGGGPGQRKVPSKKHKRPRRARRTNPYTPVIYLCIAMLALGIGVKIFNSVQRHSFYETQYRQALALEASGEYSKSLDLFQEVEEATAGTDLAQKAAQSSGLVKKRMQDEKELLCRYDQLKDDYRSGRYDAPTYVAKLRELKERSPRPGFQRSIADEIKEVLPLCRQQTQSPVSSGDALPVEDSQTGPQHTDSPETDTALPRNESEDSSLPRQILDKPDIRESLDKSRWDQAVERLQGYRAGNPEHVQAVDGYIEDIQTLAALERSFFDALAKGELQSLSVDISGKKGVATGFKNDKLVVKLESSGTAQFKWRDLPAPTRIRLLRNMPVSSRNSLGAATLCMVFATGDADSDLLGLLGRFPDQKPAVDAFLSRWRGIPVPEGGFVTYQNRLVRPEDRMLIVYQAEVQKVFSRESTAPETLATALERLHERSQAQADMKLRKQMEDSLLSQSAALRKQIIDQMMAKFKSSGGQLHAMKKLHEELVIRRKQALELITDEKKYSKDNRDFEDVQREVDRLVATVKKTWEESLGTIVELSPSIARCKRQIETIDVFLQGKYGEYYRNLPQDERLDFIQSFVNSRVNIQNYAGNGQERRRILYNQKLLEENDAQTDAATEAECKQVRITNEYRHMMGLSCLKLEKSLTASARGHSEYMRKNGVFAHEVKGEPDGETPSARARNAGYPGSVGENIFTGSADPASAHASWLHSPPHHRNILNPRWRSMGAGVYDTLWTQNFGEN